MSDDELEHYAVLLGYYMRAHYAYVFYNRACSFFGAYAAGMEAWMN